MMLPTHALFGLALALPISFLFPEFGSIVLLSGLLGGIFPDFDLYTGHRKTLHYPVYYSILSVVTIPTALLVPSSVSIAMAVGLTAAAVHCVMDIFGGGLELRPWEATSDLAVYDHLRGQWIGPRRWIRYDGAPEDFLLSVSIAGPLLIVLDGHFLWIVLLAVIVSAIYAGFRRILPTIAEILIEVIFVEKFPDRIIGYLPARYTREEVADKDITSRL